MQGCHGRFLSDTERDLGPALSGTGTFFRAAIARYLLFSPVPVRSGNCWGAQNAIKINLYNKL